MSGREKSKRRRVAEHATRVHEHSRIPPGPFSMHEAARLTGLSTFMLRAWEHRYGWPQPERRLNGYRTFSAETIADLRWVVDRLANGDEITDVLYNGALRRGEAAPKATPIEIDFSAIPVPTTAEGRTLRQRLEIAIRAGDAGDIALIESLAVRLRPAERELAVTGLLRAVRAKES